MIIAQITDLHLGMQPESAGALNAQRMEMVLADIARRDVQPDLLLATGDLTDLGDAHSYAQLTAALKGLSCPVHVIPGNHDDRDNLLAAFPGTPMVDGFMQYAIELDELRVLMLDTLELGRHGAGFCEIRAGWLADRVAETPDRPTLIAMHHPPFATGIPWMTSDASEPWRRNFDAAISRATRLLGVTSGHLHRPMLTSRSGTTMMVCPSVAPMLALRLAPMDPNVPDNRALVNDGPPGYAYHQWSEDGLLTHFKFVGDSETLAVYDEGIQPFIAEQFAERE